MLCAAIDIGSNTTRVLVAEPVEGQLKKVMEQRAYTRINKAIDDDGRIETAKIEEVGEVVATQVRLARELGAEQIRAVATAAVREAENGRQAALAIGAAAGVPVEILSDEEEGRLSFIGATKTLGHPVEGKIGVVDVGGGSTEVILGTVSGGVESVRSWRVGSGVLADELIASDPPSAAEIRKVRDRIDDIFEGVEIEHPAQAVAVGGSATSLRRLVGAVLEYETLERGIRVLSADPAADVARRFELDPRRVRILTTGVLLLEKVSELLGQPLQIGKGGLREGVILDLLNGSANGSSPARLAAADRFDYDRPCAGTQVHVTRVHTGSIASQLFAANRGICGRRRSNEQEGDTDDFPRRHALPFHRLAALQARRPALARAARVRDPAGGGLRARQAARDGLRDDHRPRHDRRLPAARRPSRLLRLRGADRPLRRRAPGGSRPLLRDHSRGP